MQHRRHHHLYRGDVLAHLLVVVIFVDLPRRVEHHQPELQQLRVRIGDIALHELLVRQAAALGLAAQRPLAHHVQRPAGHADRPHGVVDAAATQPCLRDHERLPFAAQHRVGRHPHVVVVDQGM